MLITTTYHQWNPIIKHQFIIIAHLIKIITIKYVIKLLIIIRYSLIIINYRQKSIINWENSKEKSYHINIISDFDTCHRFGIFVSILKWFLKYNYYVLTNLYTFNPLFTIIAIFYQIIFLFRFLFCLKSPLTHICLSYNISMLVNNIYRTHVMGFLQIASLAPEMSNLQLQPKTNLSSPKVIRY